MERHASPAGARGFGAKRRSACRRAAVVLATAAACALAACTERRSSAELLAEARTLHAAGDRKAAIVKLKSALLVDPDHPETRTLLAAAYAGIREHRAAEVEYRRALELQPDAEPLMAGLVRALVRQGEFGKALDELESHGRRRGRLAPALLALQGDARLGLGLDDDARMSYESALAAAPHLPEAKLGLARLAAAARRTDEALDVLAEVVQRAPTNVEALLLRGDVLHATERLDEAEAAYRSAHAALPDDTRARALGWPRSTSAPTGSTRRAPRSPPSGRPSRRTSAPTITRRRCT